ncbi:MAG: hypothetical protein ACM3MD_07160 [Betaproteobacteria bacterium]
MKAYLRTAAVLVIAGVIVLVLFLMKEASKPESVIIGEERKKLADSIDKNRAENDPIYARSVEEKLQFLDYRQAIAYNSENKPDEAIAVLKTLISTEQAKSQRGITRRSRSYANEARYYEALGTSFELKHDEDNAKKAAQNREELLAKASELRKREEREEGRSVGLTAQ